MGPEFFSLESQNKDLCHTEHSDCYALGMVIYEVLSGHIPFHQDMDFTIVQMVVQGGHPERPQGTEGVWFTDDVWKLLKDCWVFQPKDRPSIKDVLLYLERV